MESTENKDTKTSSRQWEIVALKDKSLEEQANDWTDRFLSRDGVGLEADGSLQETKKRAVSEMGIKMQKRAASQSEALKQPIKTLAAEADEGHDVANALVQLKMKVEEIDPNRFDFESGWFSRLLGKIPGVGSPIKRYFSKYETAQTTIAAIIRALENGRDKLKRDNVTLAADKKEMQEMALELERSIALGKEIDQQLQKKLASEIAVDSAEHKWISEELLFPLRQRLIDLQQQLAVQQQGVLAIELISRNNDELIKGVNRALTVTVTALEVGVTIAMALANQKQVLEQVNAVSDTTSDLIAKNAERLKTQGAEVQRQASQSQIKMDALKSAFADIQTALNDISQFRQQALPKMAETILELDKLSQEAKQSIEKMDGKPF